MQNVTVQLALWREAERRRDGLAVGSAAWQEAEVEVRSAEKAYHAELAQASARYAEEEFQAQDQGPHLNRQTSEVAD